MRVHVTVTKAMAAKLGDAVPQNNVTQSFQLDPGPLLQRPWSLIVPTDDGGTVHCFLDGHDALPILEFRRGIGVGTALRKFVCTDTREFGAKRACGFTCYLSDEFAEIGLTCPRCGGNDDDAHVGLREQRDPSL